MTGLAERRANPPDRRDKDEPPPPKPCMWCKRLTEHVVLATLGERCTGCYQAFLRQMPDRPSVMGGQFPGPRGWARALLKRHELGEPLTNAQLDMARGAVKSRGMAGEGAQ